MLIPNALNMISEQFFSGDQLTLHTLIFCRSLCLGLPHRNNNRHAYEIAEFALSVQRMMRDQTFTNKEKGTVQLRIGVNTGKRKP